MNSARATWVPTLFLTLGLVGLAAVAWYWWRGEQSAPPPPPIVDRSAPDPAGRAVPATVHVEEARTAAGTPADAPVAAELHRFDILVVDAATQQPVADAEAYWSDRDTHARVQLLPKAEQVALQGDPEGTAQRFGSRARSDRSGHLRLGMAGQGGWIYARAGDRFGSLVLSTLRPPPDGGYQLLLEREEGLSVRVLDAAGAPAEGVPIRLSASADENGGGAGERVASGRSDAAGMATFVHLQQHRRLQDGQDEGTEVLAFVVGVAIPGLAIEPAVVKAKPPLPKEPIELRLPPTGSLRLRFLFEGKPVPGIFSANLTASQREEFGERPAGVRERVGDDGWVWFPRVPPGVPLFAEPSGIGMSVMPSNQIPAVAAGTLLQHQVELGASGMVLRGRLLDPTGQPIGKESFLVEYGIDNGGGGSQGVLSDERGVFLQFLGQLSKKSTAQLTKFELRSMKRFELRLTVPTRELQAGVNELGDLHFGGEPLVCQGRFEGLTQLPTNYGVLATIEQERIHRTTGEATWHALEQPKVGVGRDGVFVARGVVEPGRYRLRVAAREYLPVAPIEFRVGQQDLVVPMRRGLGLTVECLLPDGAGDEQIQLDLVGGPAREPVLDDPSAYFPSDNRRGHCWSTRDSLALFQWSAVEPGTYALHVSLLGLAEPVHTVPEVVLPAPDGGERHLPRIDLRSVLRVVQLRLVDAAGQPATPDGYAFLQPQAGPRWLGTIVDHNNAAVLVPTAAQPLLLVGDGHRPCSLSVAPGQSIVDVHVEPWPHVELLLGPGVTIPEGCKLAAYTKTQRVREPVPFKAIFRSQSTGGALDRELQVSSGYAELRAAGEPARLELGDGPRQLGLVLRRGGEQRVLQRFTPSEVVAGAPVTITLDHEELADAAKALAAKAERK
ncbi:MAG: Ig-like domain-containing protein [Planctomycetes bacterium]|nr:Ig-like domain-containing protein [Planctomycetota bacterium]